MNLYNLLWKDLWDFQYYFLDQRYQMLKKKLKFSNNRLYEELAGEIILTQNFENLVLDFCHENKNNSG